MSEGADRRLVLLLGLGVEPGSGQAVMLLREPDARGRALPIRIGTHQAHALGQADAAQPAPRPLSHQLLANVIAATGQRLTGVAISGVSGGVFHAELVLDTGARVDARPSDAVPVAVAAGVPIFVAVEVLDQAGVPLERVTGSHPRPGDPPAPPRAPTEVAAVSPAEIDAQAGALRAWLERVSAAEFTSGADPGRGAGPDDRGDEGRAGPG